MKNSKGKSWLRILLIACGLAMVAVLFFPMWRIELNAPQYPEGLNLLIFANKLGGNVDIINGLNHYIGMNTLHTEDFIEFKVLPYIIVLFAVLFIVTGIIAKRKMVVAAFLLFVIFGIVAMVDFWRWEYNYGHNLNPNAAIIVPGMAYQPPLIGYKQLLNFGAYSIPDIGGWIFVSVGFALLLFLVVSWVMHRKEKRSKMPVTAVAAVFLTLLLSSCKAGPEPLRVGVDNCHYCKMTIADARFGAEVITTKGKIYKFDDTHCILSFIKTKDLKPGNIQDIYFTDFSGEHRLGKVAEMFLCKADAIKSPMGANVAAFRTRSRMDEAMRQYNCVPVSWEELSK